MNISDIKTTAYKAGTQPALESSRRIFMQEELEKISIAIFQLNQAVMLIKNHLEEP